MFIEKKSLTLKVERFCTMFLFLQKIAAILYGFAIRVRNMIYDTNIIEGVKFNIPVICIGNITAGGTGKTPMVEFVTSHFMNTRSVAIISRGYGRTTSGYRVVTPFDNASDVGDEPLQIKCKFPDIPVVVCERRVEGIERLLKEFPNVDMVIMDDGFQHRRVKPYLNIVMIDYTRPVDKDHYIPYGQLRDSLDSLERAHIFVFTKCPKSFLQLQQNLLIASLNKKPSQAAFFTRPQYLDTRAVVGNSPVALPVRSNVIALAGIGNNEVFFSGLAERYNVVESIGLDDHHKYSANDIQQLTNALEKHPDAFIITTEKDAVKLCNIADMPIHLSSRMFYETVGMEFASNPSTTSQQMENTFRQLLDNEIKKFNDGAYIRGC